MWWSGPAGPPEERSPAEAQEQEYVKEWPEQQARREPEEQRRWMYLGIQDSRECRAVGENVGNVWERADLGCRNERPK